MGSAIIVFYNFPLSYDIVSVVFMLMDYIIFIYSIMLMPYNMLMPDYTLGSGAIKYFSDSRFVTAFMTAACAITVHVFVSLK